MKSLYLILAISMIAPFMCFAQGNPFFEEWKTPFEMPPFDKIKTEHFMPAMKKGFEIHAKEIQDIANNPEKPTFKNTIEAMDYSGELLTKVSLVFYNWTSSNTSKELQDLANEIAPLASKHSDDITLNSKLFARIKAVYDQRKTLKLNREQEMVLEKTYKSFARNGAALNEKDKEKLRKINQDLSMLELKFGDNVLAENNSYKLVIDKKEDLAGLSEGLIAAASETADEKGLKGKWVFTLQNPSVMPFLQYADNRELRKIIWTAYMMRGNNGDKYDNNNVIKDMIKLKIERSNLLGFKTYADYSLDNVMAKNTKNVYDLLGKLWKPAINMAKKEVKDMQAIIDKEGGKFKLEPWDYRYYAEKVKKAKFDLDEEMLKPYFELNNVREGLFMVVNKLYGLKFVERKDLPKFNDDMQMYEILDAAGNHLAVVSFDFYPRANKRGGAWMSNYRNEYIKDGKRISPIIPLTFNFTKPTKDLPALLTIDEVTTMFHEFGHGLHGLLSKCTYPSVAGTEVARDFVELPSQVLENWATAPEVLRQYAKNYKTGEIIPDALIKKMENSSKFNQGFATTEYLAASYLDMKFHDLTDASKLEPQKFEKEVLSKLGLIPEIISRYRCTYFNHAFTGEYSAGYYSYIWAEVLDADAFAAFTEKGIFDPKTAKAFRENILEKGGSEDPMVLYKTFRGKDASIEPLIKRRGLDATK
jgi:peptidyl-dipeptidase Dcp